MSSLVFPIMQMFLLLTAASVVSSAQSVILGALEDVPGVYAGEASSRHVRVLFRKGTSGWEAFPSNCPDQACLRTVSAKYPREVTWYIALDGRNIGQVRGRTPKEFEFYSSVGLQEISSVGSVPTVGKRSAEYGGFTDASVYRPLAAISEPFFGDPERWRVSQISADLVALLHKQFRRRYAALCRLSKQDESKLEPLSYRDAEVKLVKSYASNTGWRVARLHLPGAIACDDTEAGFEIDDPWFAITPEKTVRYLDNGMWLVEAGDYDNDGKSELLFAIDRYNRGGYKLFYDGLNKQATFEFNYH